MPEIKDYMDFAPIIVIIILFIMQTKIFVTPEILEKKHREILNECQKRFASVIYIEELKIHWSEMKEKIDTIYDYFLENKG